MSVTADRAADMTDGVRTDVRVCVVTPYPPAPSETFIRDHVERLPARVTLVHSWPPSVGTRPALSLPARAWHKLTRTLTGEGLQAVTTAGYVAAFKRSRAEAVLAEYGTTGVEAMEACRRLDIPLVVHFHGFDASVREVLEENAASYPAMFRQAAAIIAVSRAMERKLVSLGASPEKVHYNPCGIDCEKFDGAEPASAPPVFLAVGRFVEKKAPRLTLEAFAAVREEEPTARLRMIGDGPLLEECRAHAVRLALGGAVTFLGTQPHDAVRDEMRAARCFVQHSVEAENGDCEGTPVGVLEAGASGLPVVATRHAGIPDVVVEGETGLLVEERDARAMAAAMLRLARDPGLAARMGRAARRRVAENFSSRQRVGRLWSIIESCVAHRAHVSKTPAT